MTQVTLKLLWKWELEIGMKFYGNVLKNGDLLVENNPGKITFFHQTVYTNHAW